MSPKKSERRKHLRLDKTFIVSYRIYAEADNYDLTQTKNISVGGMLLTTNRLFRPGTVLSIDIRLPFLMEPLNLKGRVIESKEVARHLIYDTHLEVFDVDIDSKETINKTVVYNLKKRIIEEGK
ncbi:MAG TPA: PilZ domain-containing protein [Candidatus Omnitrophica bacterium]|nr:PilZ domain-containing protein [Candidatus Omnitrophota bacterium]